MSRSSSGALIEDLSTPCNEQARKIAEIIQRVDPDILLLNEIDYDEYFRAVGLFEKNYLEIGQSGATPVFYDYVFAKEVNTGILSGYDFDRDGRIDGPGDAFGYGLFPGQYAMALFSKYPILENRARTFQRFLWKHMPENMIPSDYYTKEELGLFRLSSKSHWDIPVDVNGTDIHALCSHPTPPVHDGEEERNRRRNHDEIRFWADYVTPGNGKYIYDDNGLAGGFPISGRFVILGDMNADPARGESCQKAALQLLDNRIIDSSFTPQSAGGQEQSGDGKNTASWGLRVDYVLPSATGFRIENGGVFWPTESSPLHRLVKDDGSSDHRLVWMDLSLIRKQFDGHRAEQKKAE